MLRPRTRRGGAARADSAVDVAVFEQLSYGAFFHHRNPAAKWRSRLNHLVDLRPRALSARFIMAVRHAEWVWEIACANCGFESDVFVALARRQIVTARIRLAEGRVSPQEARELWSLIDWIETVIKMRVRSFEGELEQIDRELEQRFRRL